MLLYISTCIPIKFNHFIAIWWIVTRKAVLLSQMLMSWSFSCFECSFFFIHWVCFLSVQFWCEWNNSFGMSTQCHISIANFAIRFSTWRYLCKFLKVAHSHQAKNHKKRNNNFISTWFVKKKLKTHTSYCDSEWLVSFIIFVTYPLHWIIHEWRSVRDCFLNFRIFFFFMSQSNIVIEKYIIGVI